MSVKTCKVQKKRCYQTQFQAEEAMVKAYKKKRIKTFGSYYHKGCGYWHLTSQYDNRTPGTLRRFEDMHRPPNPPKPKEKMQLTRQEIHEAMLRLHNEPAGKWLRFKNLLLRLIKKPPRM